MILLSDIDILVLKVALASSLAYAVQHTVTNIRRKTIAPLIPKREITQRIGRVNAAPTRSIKKKLAQTSKHCVIFYGSQTGTAEKFASILSKEAQTRFGIESLVASLEDFDFDDLLSLPEGTIVMFLLATYGEGEPTDNAITFDQFCNSTTRASETTPINLQYAAFGLGSSSYQQFNAMIRRVDSKLASLGSKRLGELGLGDDGKGTLEDDFLIWKDKTLPILAQRLGFPERENKFEAMFNIGTIGSPSADTFVGEPNKAHLRGNPRGPYSASNPLPAPIVEARQVFSSGDRRCLHIEFDIKDSTMTYETGDHLAVWPSNSNIEIARFLRVFGLTDKKDMQIRIHSRDPTIKTPIPTNTTYEAAARYYIDVCAPVSRHILALLMEFAVDERTRSQLRRLSVDGDALQEEVRRRHLNLAQLLESFNSSARWSHVPFSLILENMKKLQPRFYSISSSSLASKKQISITAVVESQKPADGSREFKGVATNYLLSQAQSYTPSLLADRVEEQSRIVDTHELSGPRNRYSRPTALIHVRRSKFRLPAETLTPVIMIGPGTGVAPFRAFTRERALQASKGKKIGRMVLFYGCRRRDEDFLYENEWKEVGQSFEPGIFDMHVAFSRESAKIYVQNLLQQNADELRTLVMERGACVYVCGDAKRMAKDVFKTMAQIITGHGKFDGDAEGAENYLKELKKSGRWSEDVW